MTFAPRLCVGAHYDDVFNAAEGRVPFVGLFTSAGMDFIGDPLPSTARGGLGAGGGFYWGAENRVIHVGSDLYCVARDGLYRFQPAGNWSNALIDGGAPFTNPAPAASSTYLLSGVHLTLNTSNEPILFGMYNTATAPLTNVRGWSLNLTTSVFTEGPDAAITGLNLSGNVTGSAHSGEVFFGGQLYVPTSGTSVSLLALNPNTLSITRIAYTNAGGKGQWCIFRNRLFWVGQSQTGSLDVRLFELQGSIMTELLTVRTTGFQQTNQNGLFTDGTRLFVLSTNNSSTTAPLQIRQINFNSGFAGPPTLGADLTSVVLPAAWRTFGVASLSATNSPGGGTGGIGAAFRTWVDVNSSGVRTVYVSLMGAGAATPGLYCSVARFVDNATVMPIVSEQALMNGYAFPSGSQQGGGERVYYRGRPGLVYTDITAAVGGETVSYIPSGGQTNQTVRALIDPTNGQMPPTQAATIINPVTGGILNVNNLQVDAVNADGAVKTLTIAGSSTGFGSGDPINYMLTIGEP